MEGTYHFMFECRRDSCRDRYLFSKMALLVLALFVKLLHILLIFTKILK